MAVWADEPQIGFAVIFAISIDVVNFKWYRSAPKIHLRPTAKPALATELFVEISLYVGRDKATIAATSDLASLPSGNEVQIAIISLTLPAAKSSCRTV